MEIENDVRPIPPVEEPETKEKNRDIWVILLNIFLALVTIFLLAFVAYKNGYIDLDNIFKTKDQNQEEKDTEEEDTSKEEQNMEIVEEGSDTFEGEVLSATFPSGWRVEEYMNGEGSEMLVDGVTYTGLTGLKIFNGNKEIMRLGAVSGIGFVGCSELAIFGDSNPAYRTEMEEMNEEVGMEMNITDYVSAEVTEFEWFGKDFRRVNTFLYFDSVAGNNFFEPQCEKGLITVPGLTFADGDGYEGSAYYYGINELATGEELIILDEILASMVVL